LIEWILKFLVRRGRAWALVDFYGDVQMYRMFPFFYESHNPTGWRRRLPNMMVHLFPGEPGGSTPDLSSHSHPWSSLGIILRGQYTERINRTKVRINKAPAATFVSYRSHHQITSVKPGTVTLFFHWIRRNQHWTAHSKKCLTLCKACTTVGLEDCPFSDGAEPFKMTLDSGEFSKDAAATWMRMDAGFEERIKARKAAIGRVLGDNLPRTNEEKMIIKLRAEAARVKEVA
jgi:hypothetical protein